MRTEIISSRNNPLVKSVCALTEKKHRLESGDFRFDGIKLFLEAVESHADIRFVILRDPVSERIGEAVDLAVRSGAISDQGVIRVTESVFDKISEERSPEGIVTVCAMMNDRHRCVDGDKSGEATRGDKRLLMLESVRDPGNLGTILRSAYSLGIERVIMSSDCADIYNPKTVRAAMGAVFKLPTLTVQVEEFAGAVGSLRTVGRRVYATALREDSLSIDSVGFSEGDCFIIGNEGHGLSDDVVEASTAPVIIPMEEGAESLNAAAAATICIWETVRHKSDREVNFYEG